MPTKKKKHAKHMTTDEAAKHLFHPQVVKHAQEHIAEHDARKSKPPKREK
jgi:hypothetical protein